MLAPRSLLARTGLALLALVAAALPSPAFAQHRVVIVSIDGLRPDVALRADMPALRALMARGSFTMFAATTDMGVTLPSHTSMLTGVPPSKHGITYNGDRAPGQPEAPKWPTLFQVAHDAGLSTAVAAGKSKFAVLAPPAAVDLRFVPARGGTATDSAVAEAAAGWIATQPPRVLFVHLPGPDLVGHASGWGSPQQVAAAAVADRALGRVVDALGAAGLLETTLVLVTADHGGAGTTHGGPDARTHWIPWVLAGPGVRAGHDLTLDPGLKVRTEDTFATACDWLGLHAPRPVDGRVVHEAFEPPTGSH
jgi:predicted AlkP superfamily pyrophosphatase or phosphodiesterase